MASGTPGTHGIDGACAPGSGSWASQQTFSVGIFEWVPKAGGKGTKRGKVKVRVKGSVSQQEQVLAKAREIAAQLDARRYTGGTSVTA